MKKIWIVTGVIVGLAALGALVGEEPKEKAAEKPVVKQEAPKTQQPSEPYELTQRLGDEEVAKEDPLYRSVVEALGEKCNWPGEPPRVIKIERAKYQGGTSVFVCYNLNLNNGPERTRKDAYEDALSVYKRIYGDNKLNNIGEVSLFSFQLLGRQGEARKMTKTTFMWMKSEQAQNINWTTVSASLVQDYIDRESPFIHPALQSWKGYKEYGGYYGG